jgi:phosphatidylethanolamine-binding protein (PEBP) family uncharacterized protein
MPSEQTIHLEKYAADAKALAEAKQDVGTWGTNTVNRRGEYAPPCSQGPGEKTYVGTVYALSAEPKLAEGQATYGDLLRAIAPITIGTADVQLKYARQDGGGNSADGRRRIATSLTPPIGRRVLT